MARTKQTARRGRGNKKAAKPREPHVQRPVDGMAETPTACRAVFQTPELLEHILFYLPNDCILASAQQICLHFHEFVTTSSKMQDKLMMRLTKQAREAMLDDREKNVQLPRDEEWPKPKHFPTQTNELLFEGGKVKQYRKDRYRNMDHLRSYGPFNKIYYRPFKLTKKFGAAIDAYINGRGGSWEKMYIADQPIRHLHFIMAWESCGSPTHWEIRGEVDVDLGERYCVTMGKIIEEAMSAYTVVTVNIYDDEGNHVDEIKPSDGDFKLNVGWMASETGQKTRLCLDESKISFVYDPPPKDTEG